MSGPDLGAARASAETLAAEFLARVLPHEGIYFIATPLPNRGGKKAGYRHYACHSISEAAKRAIDLDAKGETVYFATASFKEPFVFTPQADGTTKKQWRIGTNVRSLRCLFLDVDVKPDSATAYATQDDMFAAVSTFLGATSLPLPVCVASGRGLHLYWPTTDDVLVDQWQPLADKLKALCEKLGFRADPSRTADATSVLRVPGTHHRKDPANPRQVEYLGLDDSESALSFSEVCEIIDAACKRHQVNVAPRKAAVSRSAGADLNAEFAIQTDYPPFSAKVVANHCQQLRAIRDTPNEIHEPLWRAGLGLIIHSQEGDDLAHEWSRGHSNYSYDETEDKLANVHKGFSGPTTCTHFKSANPAGCSGCPYADGQLTTPASLGRIGVSALPTIPPAQSAPSVSAIQHDGHNVIPVVMGDAPAALKMPVAGTSLEAAAILLPSNHYTFGNSAETIFPRLAGTRRYFTRGNEVVSLSESDRGQTLEPVTADAFRSLIDGLGCPVMQHGKGDAGKLVLTLKRCSKDSALALLASAEARRLLPKIELVSNSPILVMREGAAAILGSGYHSDLGGILVTGEHELASVSLNDAVQSLLRIIEDYDFASPGDKSRAIAALITPAMRMGRLLMNAPNAVARYPISMIEANAPQTGKGHFQQLTCAIYNERAYMVTRRNGGVGSLDESIAVAILSGRPFVNIDNVRDRLDSQYLEAILTCDGYAPARVAHRSEVRVDVRAIQFQMTSNGIALTTDLAKRSSIIRLRKRPDGYQFRDWPGGDLLTHVYANSNFYLACVFAVIGAWLTAGRPKGHAGGFHDFREWAGALGWIVTHIFGASPLLDGHQEAQERAATPALTWLRAVCIAAERAGRLEQEMLASDIVALCENEGVEIHGFKPTAPHDQSSLQVGRLFAQCFKSTAEPDAVQIEGYRVLRQLRERRDPNNRSMITDKWYRIVRAGRAS